jgi:hypothetical protein
MINREKSSVMFSTQVKLNFKILLLQILELGAQLTEGNYIGLPTYVG